MSTKRIMGMILDWKCKAEEQGYHPEYFRLTPEEYLSFFQELEEMYGRMIPHEQRKAPKYVGLKIILMGSKEDKDYERNLV